MADGENDLDTSQDPEDPGDLPCAAYPATVDGLDDLYNGSLLVTVRPDVLRDPLLPGRLAASLGPAAEGPVEGRYLIDDETVEHLRTLGNPDLASRTVRLYMPPGLPGGASSIQAALNALRLNDQVEPETAYADLAVWGGRAATVVPPPGTSDYLNCAPQGIGALPLWDEGFDGSGVMIADVEAGWGLPHEDLDPSKISPIFNQSNQVESAHGTGVLGILMASRNTLGGTGVVYGIDQVLLASHFERGRGCGHVPEAIYASLMALRAGDIILLEVQTIAQSQPVEVTLAPWQAINYAVNAGVSVIEAAGDGASSLDNLAQLSCDSGAVMVGAGRALVDSAVQTASVPPQGVHRWGDSSNYGARVNCYAWGDGILTTGPSDQWPNGVPRPLPNQAYRSDFNSTSAAAAIVAGAAALLQCAWRQKTGGKTLSPSDLRRLFATYGTAESALDKSYPIGIMPDLYQILTNFGPAPDNSSSGTIEDAVPDAQSAR